MKRLPALFHCTVCGLPVRPQDSVTERKAVVWLKSGGMSISRVIEELHNYKHSMCDDKDELGLIQDPLF